MDIGREEIYQTMADNVDVNTLASVIPLDHGRYNFYKYKHNHEGTFYNTVGRYFKAIVDDACDTKLACGVP